MPGGPGRLQVARLRDDQPTDDEIEQEDGIDGQRFPAGWLTVRQKSRRRERGPSESEDGHQQSDDEQHSVLRLSQQNQLARHQGHTRRQQTIAQYTQTLEERNGAAEQLNVGRDRACSEPRDHKRLGELGTAGRLVLVQQ